MCTIDAHVVGPQPLLWTASLLPFSSLFGLTRPQPWSSGAAHRSALLLLALSVLTFHTQHTKSAVRRANHHVPMYRESLSVIGSKLPLIKFRFAEINIIQVPQFARRKIKQTYPFPCMDHLSEKKALYVLLRTSRHCRVQARTRTPLGK